MQGEDQPLLGLVGDLTKGTLITRFRGIELTCNVVAFIPGCYRDSRFLALFPNPNVRSVILQGLQALPTYILRALIRESTPMFVEELLNIEPDMIL